MVGDRLLRWARFFFLGLLFTLALRDALLLAPSVFRGALKFFIFILSIGSLGVGHLSLAYSLLGARSIFSDRRTFRWFIASTGSRRTLPTSSFTSLSFSQPRVRAFSRR